MDPNESSVQPISPREAAAFAVHIFTASGAACALLALIAAVRTEWPNMFVWLGVALVIDGIDGTFARRLRVAEVLPRWSGDVLDLVVDILNYVFVPAYAIASGGLLPESLASALGLVVAVTGSLYFADRRMKTVDHYFRGFPALWNIAAFYLFLVKPSPWLAAASVSRPRCAHLRAVSLHPSGPHPAFARPDDGRTRRLGAARDPGAGRSPRSGFLDRCSLVRSGDLFHRRRPPAPPPTMNGPSDARTSDRSERMGGAPDTHRARDRARHRQRRLHFASRRAARSSIEPACTANRAAAGFRLSDCHAVRVNGAGAIARTHRHHLRQRDFLARHYPDRRRPFSHRQGDI